MIWGTSQKHWWSKYRRVIVERLDDHVLVHDVGPSAGAVRWVRYPVIDPDQFLTPSDNWYDDLVLDAHIDNDDLEIAAAAADLAGEFLVGKMAERHRRRTAERFAELLAMSPADRRINATHVCREVEVEQRKVSGSRAGRWVLSSKSPRVKVFFECSSRDRPVIDRILASFKTD